MPFSRAGQLARSAPAARASDPLALVAENLRNSPHGVLPVFDRVTFGPDDPSEHTARVVGLISQKELSRATQRIMAPVESSIASSGIESSYNGGSLNGYGSNGYSSNGHAANGYASNGSVAQSATQLEAPAQAPAEAGVTSETIIPPAWNELKARDVMQSDVPFIPEAFSLLNALLTLERYGYPALPVYDAGGRYRGIVSRADLISALYGGVRPPLVGGMATPLGVWLTDGRLSGGASTVGLFLSGLTLAGCLAFSQLVLALGAMLLNPAWAAMTFSGRLGIASPEGPLLNFVFYALQSALFLGALRMLPMAGIHAAEHQVVHAMERGLPLDVEHVQRMPRAHPRCGTNLMAAAGLVTIGFSHLPDVGPEYIVLLLVAMFFLWRSFGTLVQVVFTTRPATRKELESGIKAANELIAKYQAQPFAAAPLPLRLLNSGMLWSAAGMLLGLGAWGQALEWIARLVLRN